VGGQRTKSSQGPASLLLEVLSLSREPDLSRFDDKRIEKEVSLGGCGGANNLARGSRGNPRE